MQGQDQVAAGSRKLLLRLDDGSLIGRASDLGVAGDGQQVVRISVEQAAELGRASEKEVKRLEGILERLRAHYGLQAPAMVHTTAPSKKPKLETVPSAIPPGISWQAKCQEVLGKLLKHLGPHKPVFYNHVDRKVLPDYYEVIKAPLFLKDIEDRIDAHYYQQPQDFADDIKHHFSNVRLYNPEHDPFRKIGNQAEAYFDELWAATGYSQERTRRATAGMAAAKFDPETFEPPAKPKATRSQGQANKRPRDSMAARSMSHEVTSGRPPGRPSEARLQEISSYLSREDLPEEHTNHLLTLLPQEILGGLETGELELDFSMLPDETLQQIDVWLRTLPDAPGSIAQQQAAGQHAPPAQLTSPPARPSVQVDSYDDDDDYEPDSSDSERA